MFVYFFLSTYVYASGLVCVSACVYMCLAVLYLSLDSSPFSAHSIHAAYAIKEIDSFNLIKANDENGENCK